jgi:cysteine desulfurase family protein (TIGR01976 family)
MTLDIASIRRQFPALTRIIAGKPALYLDGPGGTQVPTCVTAAMTAYLERSNANVGGMFATSRETNALVDETRVAVAAFLNAAAPTEIVFGQNMTSLTFAASRAIARTLIEGDEIIVTAIDHDANVAPWLMIAEDRGAVVKTIAANDDYTITVEQLAKHLNARTKVVALTHASNAVGSIPELKAMILLAHTAGALVYVDAVHYAPHGVIDVADLGCDFLACSAYKFCGPHIGILYGKQEHLERLSAYKVRPAPSIPPGKWETGTQNFEAIAGVRAVLGYIASLGGASPGQVPNEAPTRKALVAAMQRIIAHEHTLSRHFLQETRKIPGLRLYGSADVAGRTPTFGITLANRTPRQVSQHLADRGIFIWDGHFYATNLIAQLGLADQGGLIRIGFVHYNTIDEVDRLVAELKTLAR